MSEFTVSAKIIADARGFKQGVGEAKDAVRDLGGTSQQAAAQTRTLTQETERAERAMRSHTGSVGNARMATMELGHVITASSDAFAAGIPIQRIFATEIGRVAQAATGLGGSMGGVGAFLGGPWGLAVMAGTTVLGSLVGKLFETGDQAEKSAGKLDFKRMSVVELTKAINDLEAAQRKQIQTSQQADQIALETARMDLANAVKARNETRRLLQAALTDEETKRLGASDTKGSQIAAQAVSRVKALQDDIARQDANIATLERRAREAVAPILQQQMREHYDPAARAAGEYDRTLGSLNRQLRTGAISEDAYARQLAIATVIRDRATKAAQEATRALQAHARAASQVISLDQGKGLIASIGGTVTSGFRSYDKQAQLYAAYRAGTGNLAAPPGHSDHEVGRALDVAKTAGMTAQRIADAFHAAGVAIKPIIDEGDHFHVAWGKAASTATTFARATHDAAAAEHALAQELGAVVGAFDPARAAAEKYADTLARIRDLAGKGLISPGDSIDFQLQAARDQAALQNKLQNDRIKSATGLDLDAEARDFETELLAGHDKLATSMEDVGRRGGHAFQRSGEEAARAISDIFGGKMGKTVGAVFSALSGSSYGLAGSGPVGDILALFNQHQRPGQQVDSFTQGLQEFAEPLKKGLKDIVHKIGDTFHVGGDFEKTLGHIAGGASMGALIGPGITSLFGARGSTLGGAIGGALGQAAGELLKSSLGSLGAAAGPIGAVAGSILGSLVGGMFHTAKSGGAVVTSTTGTSATHGNNATAISAASGSASSIQSALAQIADQLGGGLGSFKVSIGSADGKWSVDPQGLNRSTKAGATGFGTDQAAAVQFAIQAAIAQGAVTGLSAAVQKALQSSPNLEQALREAAQVQQVQDLMSDLGATFSKSFRDFEKQAADRVRIAKQYGFDVLKIEEMNAKDRLALEKQLMSSTVGSLQSLLDDMNFGDLFEGSLTDQITKIRNELTGAKADALAGIEGAADKVADLERSLLEKTRTAFGTAGPELGAAQDEARSNAQQIIDNEKARMKAAEDAARETNTQLNEVNDQLSEQTTVLRGIGGGIDEVAGMVSALADKLSPFDFSSTGFRGSLTL